MAQPRELRSQSRTPQDQAVAVEHFGRLFQGHNSRPPSPVEQSCGVKTPVATNFKTETNGTAYGDKDHNTKSLSENKEIRKTQHVPVELSLSSSLLIEIGPITASTHDETGLDSASAAAMSKSQPPPGLARQSIRFPNQAAYPPTVFPSGGPYSYQTVPNVHGEAYRATATNVYAPIILPNIRTLDPAMQHAPLHQAGYGMPPAPMPLVSAPLGYPNLHPAPYGGLAQHDDPSIRFTLPPNLTADPRLAMNAQRHKKVPVHTSRPSSWLL